MTDPAAATTVDRFLAATYRPRHAAQPVENHDYVAMLWRMVRAFERRAIDDAELLPQAGALAERLNEAVNVAIAAHAARYAIDARRGASMAECGRILGITKQAASKRKNLGEAVLEQRTRNADAARFAEAARERAVIDQVADAAVVLLADYRARRTA